jgi:hypothetical protein
VNVNIQPITGGSDPSVQPSAYWVLLPQPSSTFPPAYASFSSSLDQSLIQNTELAPIFNIADCTPVGITASLPSSDINITNAGLYNIHTTIQVERDPNVSPPTSVLGFYLKLNGVSVINSTNGYTTSGELSFLTSEWVINIPAAAVLSISIFSNQADNILISTLATPFPLLPSIRTTIIRIA